MFPSMFNPEGLSTSYTDNESRLTETEWENWIKFRSDLISDVCCPEGSEFVGILGTYDAAVQCMF